MTCSNVTPFNRGRSPPQLLTEAAHGCLKPPPTGRLRRAHLHLSHSTAPSRFLETTSHTTGRAVFRIRRLKQAIEPPASYFAAQKSKLHFLIEPSGVRAPAPHFSHWRI